MPPEPDRQGADLPRTWREIAKEIEAETDPIKITKLAHELNEALIEEERKRLHLKLGGRKGPPAK